MIASAALALLIGSIFGAMAIMSHLGPLAGLIAIGVLLVAFTVSEAVRKSISPDDAS